MNNAPIPKDTQDFQFKQSTVRQVSESLKTVPSGCNLIVADAKRGLLYVATDDRLTVLKSDCDTNPDWRIDYKLPYPISRLSISCDYSYLAVTFSRSTAHIYNASSLSKNSLELIHEIQLSRSSQNVFAYDLRWNPAIPGMFCTVASDHSIGTFQVRSEQKTTVGVVALEIIDSVEAMCVAWSPKGKQLVVGCKNGNIIQLKPELKVMRAISGPSPSIGQLITILWVSNYQFCAAYYNSNERRVDVLIVDAPKGADAKPTFTNYEDITFGIPDNDGEYSPRYYFDYVPEWNLIIAASSSSSEVAVLGSLNNGANWEQWQLIDSGRAQLPLVRTVESYPVGMTIDRSSITILPWGPESTLPHPVPVLHLFGTSGQIVSFHMVNLIPNCPALCSPPSEPVKVDQNITATSEINFVPHSVATSTPRPKQQELIERPKVTIPPPNFFSEPVSVKPVSALPTAPVSLQNPPGNIELKIPKPKPIEKPEMQKTEIKLLPKQTPPAGSPAGAPALAPTLAPPVVNPTIISSTPAPIASVIEKINYDDNLCWRAFREEQIHFEKELQIILKPRALDIGTDEERQKLIVQCEEVNSFIQELNETTNSLSNEISYLNSLLLQSFAWLEETKSKQSSGNVARDHHDKSKINELQRRFVHLQSQLIQAMKVLDARWADNEQLEMAKFKVPGLEQIYQCLTKYDQLIQANKKRLDEQTKKWKALSRGNHISQLNQSLSKLNISSNSPGNTDGDMIEMRCRTIANNTRNFTALKQSKLRDVLLQMEPRIIKNVNPSNIHSRLEATLSALVLQNTAPPKKEEKSTSTYSSTPPKKEEKSTSTYSSTPPKKEEKSTSTASNAPMKIIFSSVAPPETPVSKPAAKPAVQNPLASLNSIVANIGSSQETSGQNKSQTFCFPTNTFSSVFANNLTTPKTNNDKLNLTGGSTFVIKKVTTVSSITPVQTPPTTAASFSKPIPISFGSPETKSENSAPKDSTNKPVIIFKAKDTSVTQSQPLSLFGSNILETSLTKVNQPVTIPQNQPSLGSNINSSLKSSLQTPVTTSQQPFFSFASQTLTTATPKTTPTTALSESMPEFSFASKLIDTPALSSTISEQFTTTTTTQSLDLSKLSSSFSLSNLIAEKPSSVPSTTFSFSQSVTPTVLNSGKPAITVASIVPANVIVSLPAGTTIEKQPTTTPVSTQASSIFKSSPLLSSSLFGGSTPSTPTAIFGGAAATTVSQAQPLQDSNKVTSISTSTAEKPTASIFGGLSQLSFGQNQSTGSSFPGFTTTTTTPTSSSEINFGKPPATTATGLLFGQSLPAVTTATTTPSFGLSAAPGATGASTLSFGQSAAAAAATSPFAQSPATPAAGSPSLFGKSAAAAATGITSSPFGQPAAPATSGASPPFSPTAPASSGTSLFGQSNVNATTGATPSIFGQSVLSPPANTKLPPTTAPAAPSLFGGTQNQPTSSPFGGTSSLTSMFGSTSVSSESVTTGTGIGTTGSIFGGAASNTPSLFGSVSPGGGSIFGGAAAKPAASAFGGAPTFGSPPAMPTAPAFGGSPTFGSKAVFGSQPSVFGNSSPFGAAPTFGSNSGSVFGSGMPASPQDGSMSMGNTTFEALGAQNGGLSFNSLAQKSPTQDKPAFSGGSSFTSWR
ncbi:nuclear pore complex protein Nup214 isoform X2 [Cotesia glomerata]|uniref:nuclear pore complex protein Nup214 isoform X2 n=1 Tax=Cotesia glomerata TaxID=32391 RepID=UPI001D01E719|nr:nuclear pore complex protein Nup214 isoform X2 [Cotesia glomerata]